MSTTNEVVAALQQNLDKARELFAKRLLPAKLKVDGDDGLKNGRILKAWLVRKDLQSSLPAMTPQALADELYRAVQEDVEQFPQSRLVWEVPPKALKLRASKSEPTKVGDTREASSFEEKSHAADEALKAQKLQDEAKKRCQELVERFAPINHRRGTLNFDLRDAQKKKWAKQIDEAKDFVKLETEIKQEQRKIYESLERAAERV